MTIEIRQKQAKTINKDLFRTKTFIQAAKLMLIHVSDTTEVNQGLI